jgi:hypothetical protein
MRTFSIKAKMFAYTIEPTSWYFVSLDKKLSLEIKEGAKKKVGFSFVPVEVTLGSTTWRTTLFPTKQGSYLLAIKKMVRQKEDVLVGETLKITFRLV